MIYWNLGMKTNAKHAFVINFLAALFSENRELYGEQEIMESHHWSPSDDTWVSEWVSENNRGNKLKFVSGYLNNYNLHY